VLRMYAPREMFCLVACLFLTKVVNIVNFWMIQFEYVVNKVLMVPVILPCQLSLRS